MAFEKIYEDTTRYEVWCEERSGIGNGYLSPLGSYHDTLEGAIKEIEERLIPRDKKRRAEEIARFAKAPPRDRYFVVKSVTEQVSKRY